MTFTGNHIPGTPNEIRPAPKTIGALKERVESLRPKETKNDNYVPRKTGEKSDSFFRRVNDRAMTNLSAWVPIVFPTARKSANGAWRVTSEDLGRPELEEDLSIAPEGIVDFGLHDMGDPREGKRTPIDVVRNYPEEGEEEKSIVDAAFCLCEMLGVDPVELGWEEREEEEFDPDVFDDLGEDDNVKATGATVEACANNFGEPFDPWARYVVPKFPLEIFPLPVANFVEANAENIGCDAAGIAMSILAAFSGAIDHRFKLKLKRHGSFDASPRLWIILVGDPSVKKSPMMRAAMDPLRAVDRELHDRYEAFGESLDIEKPPRFIAGDTTIEALQQILSRQQRGILVYRDEIAGWIGSMEKYSGGGRGSAADRGFWLQSYDGGTFYVDRVGRGEMRIKNLSVSFLGGIQPERLAELHGLTTDGLLQRFAPVMLAAPRYSLDRPVDQSARSYDKLIRQLVDLEPARLAMTDDAIEALGELHRWLHDLEQNTRGVYAGFQGFVGKLTGLSGSLALILHIIDDPQRNAALPVEAWTIKDVAKLVREFLIPHAFEFYRSAEATTNGDRLQRIASWLLTSKAERIVASDLSRNVAVFRGKKVADVADMVSPMVAGGWLLPEQKGARPTAWRVNPKVHALFAGRAEEEERRKAALAEAMGARTGTKST